MATAAVSLAVAAGFVPPTLAAPPPLELPSWIDTVGAGQAMKPAREISANAHGARPDTESLSTAAIQAAIEECARAGGGVVTFEPGTYRTGAIFLRDNVYLKIGDGVTLLATNDESAYPRRWTRVAGIEMEWPAALINLENVENAGVFGTGTIDGNGEFWWRKYWDMRRNDYEPRGLRWAVDYDCERVRLLVVWRSSGVTIEDVHLRRSGFWTVQVCYSEHVTVDGVRITDNQGPSTDGIDIDSSSQVLVQNCDIDNNDDCICLKAGRDWDGLRVNRPTEYVVIRHNVTRRGGGVVSFGSETSGGIRHIVAYENRGLGTNAGLRFKSARTRGGYVADVLLRDIVMENVRSPFSFTLDWNPSYSYATLPKGVEKIPPHWKVLTTPVEPAERGYAEFRDITIANITATGARRILDASGLPEKPLGAMRWENVTASGREAGAVTHARGWEMHDVVFTTPAGEPVVMRDTQDVDEPVVKKASTP